MAEEVTQTAVTETDGTAKPAQEATDAQKTEPSLDDLLKEFEQETTIETQARSSKPDKQSEASADSPDTSKRLEALEQRLAEEQLRKDLSPVIEKIKEGFPLLENDEIIDLLDGRAKRDPRLANAWANRHTNPKGWEKVVDAIGRDMSGRLAKLPDKAATEDREAVTAAVRGASTRASEGKAPSYGKMSDREFSDTVEKELGFRPL